MKKRKDMKENNVDGDIDHDVRVRKRPKTEAPQAI